jgi:hypothetical protein
MERLKGQVRRWPAVYRYAGIVFALGWDLCHRLGLGGVPPPHAYKALLVKRYGRRHGLRTLVETGTYHGHMIEAVRRSFALVYSIELDDAFYEAARDRFRVQPHVHLLHGDSGALVQQVVSQLREPALFWLDAHFSGAGTAGEGTNPIESEIRAILGCREERHVVLIDDARLFTGTEGYPTLQHIHDLIRAIRPRARMQVDADVIRIEGRR